MIWNWSLADFYVIDWILQINNHFDYSINKIRSVESWKHLEHNANTHPEIGAKLISHALLRQLASTADQLTKKSSVPTSLLSVTVPAYITRTSNSTAKKYFSNGYLIPASGNVAGLWIRSTVLLLPSWSLISSVYYLTFLLVLYSYLTNPRMNVECKCGRMHIWYWILNIGMHLKR